MIKNVSTTANWVMFDSLRAGYNVDNDQLYANAADGEATTDLLDITANGFKIRSTDASVNGSTNQMLFLAFAEAPSKYSRAR
jgi:hypothetical protein